MWRSSRTRAGLIAATLALGVAVGAYAYPVTAGQVREVLASPRSGLQDPVLPSAAARRVSRRDVRPHSFYFSRAVYSGGRGSWFYGGSRAWMTDYPKADRQFLVVLRRLSNLDAYELEHPIELSNPDVRRFPFLYAVEVGNMSLTNGEAKNLREYLLAGGFLMVDDFWGTYEWSVFEEQMRRVFPEYPIVDIPQEHEVFHTYYDIDEVVQVPNVGQGIAGGPTHERDGYVPHVRGIFDEHGRLMVVINWNTDLGDAWEWAEQAEYPLKYSTYAYQMAVNFIVYAMSH